MIAEMDKLLIVGRRKQAEDVLSFLQRLGVVQIDSAEKNLASSDVDEIVEKLEPFELKGEARLRQDAQENLLSQSQLLLRDTLGLGEAADLPLDGSSIPKDAKQQQLYLDELSAEVDELLREKTDAEDVLETIGTYLPIYQTLQEDLEQVEQSQYLQGTPVIVDKSDVELLEATLKEDFTGSVLVVNPYKDGDYLVLVVTMKKHQSELQQVLSRLGIGVLDLPTLSKKEGEQCLVADVISRMLQKQATLPQRIINVDEALVKIGKENKVKLATIHERAKDESQRYDAMADLLAGSYSFVLSGWVPSRLSDSTVETLQKRFGDDLIIETEKADPVLDTRAPVELHNPDWVKPFQGLLSLFAPPTYGTFDPSWTIAVFFPLYFGMVVGDIGFGIMFALIGMWLRHLGHNGEELDLGPLGITLKPKVLPAVGTVINWCAAWSAFFGFLYGEFFGNLLERFPANHPIFYSTVHHEAGYGLIPVFLPRVETFTPLLLATIAFGVLQVLGGWAIRGYYAYKHYNTHHLWESIGMFSGISAVVVFSYGFLTENLNPFVLGFAALGFTIFLYAVVKSGVLLMLVEVISNSGNILSYLRLFAVGLSAALVANLVTDLGFAIGGTLPIIGPILGIIVGLVVHLIAIALTIIGHTLQPLRLQYVEFFTKFGFYEDNGRPYNPLRFLGGK